MRPILRFLFPALAISLLFDPLLRATPDNVRFSLVSRAVVEARLGRYGGNNEHREATLKKMFSEAGCDDQHLSEQTVKGSKLPNVVCILTGHELKDPNSTVAYHAGERRGTAAGRFANQPIVVENDLEQIIAALHKFV